MTISEADEIFKVWQQWFWPFHSLLNSIFRFGIPESFLPYPKSTLYEAIDIELKLYENDANSEEYKAIEITKSFLSLYENDKDAFDTLLKNLSIPEMVETTSNNIKKFTNEWINWQKRSKN